MKIFGKINECCKKMEPLSKRIVTYGLWFVLLLYSAGILYLMKNASSSDLTTTLYWAEQIWLLGKELLGATIVPALIFEIICFCGGLKNSAER